LASRIPDLDPQHTQGPFGPAVTVQTTSALGLFLEFHERSD
jgi:hypothetical protein